MSCADQYHRFVRWSDEDSCYIGYCPDLYLGGVCHGDSEEAVYRDLCEIVRAEVAHRRQRGDALPAPRVRAVRELEFA